MATLCGRAVFQTCRRSFSYTATKCSQKLPTPMEMAPGVQKLEMMAEADGNDDPFLLKVIKRGPGTKECPNLVPSAFQSRIVGCICEDDQTHVNWMWLHQGSPRRCECGYWFKLIEKQPA